MKQSKTVKYEANYSIVPLTICGTMLGLTLGIGVTLASSTVSADDNTSVVDEINITVPISCTMSGTGQTSHNAEIANGTYTPNIGTTTLHAFCNDNEGFAIYAAGYTGDEIGATNSNKLVGTSASGSSTIESGIATSAGNPDISNWAMKLTMTQDSGDTTTNPFTIDSAPNIALPSEAEQGATSASFSDYHVVPNEYVKVAHKDSMTDMDTTTGGVKLTTTYAAYISKTQPADTYTGQVKYTLVHPSNRVAPEPPMGLCTDSYTCMQQQTLVSLAQKLPNIGDTTTLYDARDNQAYTVAKLKDGKYWMTENLNIAGGTVLSSEDTDFDSSYTLPTTDGWTTTGTNHEKLVLPASATKNPDNNNLTDSTQFSANNYAYVFNSGNKTDCGASGQNTPCYSYYSWDAATLGSGRALATDNTDADYSICPKNWRLPNTRTGTDSSSDFRALMIGYGGSEEVETYNANTDPTGATMYGNIGPNTVPDFLLAGRYYGGGLFYNGGGAGFYWSTTSFSISFNAAQLSLNSSRVTPANSNNRASGHSVRCLFGE